MTKTCLICGKEFDTNRKQVVCCSDSCKKIRARQLQKKHNDTYRQKRLSKAEQLSLEKTGKILADTIADNNIIPNWQVPNPALRTLYPLHRPQRQIIIPAAVAQNRKPTTDELLDWIFKQK